MIRNWFVNKSQVGVAPVLRDDRIDSLKYWLIILVIAGHVFSQDLFSGCPVCIVIWKWIYMFHMPLFVFISGRFTYKKNKSNFKKSIWKLLEPLIVFQFIMCSLVFVQTGVVSFKLLLTPWWVLWYLLSLIYWRLIIQLPTKILNNAGIVIFASFCISLIAGFLPFNRFLSIQRTLSFMPFFFLGYYTKQKRLYIPDSYRPLSIIFLISTMFVPFFIPNILGDLNQAAPYGRITGLFSRLFVWLFSIPMSLAFMNLCPKMKWTSQQGRFTLQYYIYHALIIWFVMYIGAKMELSSSYITATLITVAIVLGIGIASRFPYFCAFTNPSALIKK